MKYIVFIAIILGHIPSAFATPITFTGAEFANLSNVTFSTGSRSTIGDSLRINATISRSVLAEFSFANFNVDISDFEVQLDLTRRITSDGGFDHDPQIYLSDGRNLFGGSFFDFNLVPVSFQARQQELANDGVDLINLQNLGTSSGISVAAESNFLATIRVQATAANTTITGEANNGAIGLTAVTSTLFDPSNGGPSLIFASDNANERYQINSISFTRGVTVAEPGTLASLGFGLMGAGLCLYRRRHRAFLKNY